MTNERALFEAAEGTGPGDVLAIERPVPPLLTYYLLTAFFALPVFPIVMLVRYFRYHTMRYRFDEEGISMSWGVLFRREIHLTYSRIQDIHLASNLVERWLGLARIEIQTASGSAKAEMILEGIPRHEAMRDFLYARMRGMRGGVPAADRQTPRSAVPEAGDGELAAVLRDVTAELRALRAELAGRSEDRGAPER